MFATTAHEEVKLAAMQKVWQHRRMGSSSSSIFEEPVEFEDPFIPLPQVSIILLIIDNAFYHYTTFIRRQVCKYSFKKLHKHIFVIINSLLLFFWPPMELTDWSYLNSWWLLTHKTIENTSIVWSIPSRRPQMIFVRQLLIKLITPCRVKFINNFI